MIFYEETEGRDEGRDEGHDEGRDGGRDAGPDEGRDEGRDGGHVQAAVPEEATHAVTNTPSKRKADATDAIPSSKRARLCSSPPSPISQREDDVGPGIAESQPKNEASKLQDNAHTPDNDAKYEDQAHEPGNSVEPEDQVHVPGTEAKPEDQAHNSDNNEASPPDPLIKPPPEAAQLPNQQTPFAENRSTYKGTLESWLDSILPLAEDEQDPGGDDNISVPPSTIMPSVSSVAVGISASMNMASSTAPHSEANTAKIRNSTQNAVSESSYREHLEDNGIYLRSTFEALPDFIAELVQHIRQATSAPLFSEEDFRAKAKRLEDNPDEAFVHTYFATRVFCEPADTDTLLRSEYSFMHKEKVPSISDAGALSTPAPDILFGYNSSCAFPDHLRMSRHPSLFAKVNNLGLMYPFLVVEFKGEKGDLWSATNQCLGGASTAVRALELFESRLSDWKVEGLPAVMRVVFSAAVNGYYARLFVSWRTGKNGTEKYYTQKIQSFDLATPAQHIDFHRQVQNIIAWARTERLEAFRSALGRLKEANWQPPAEPTSSRSRKGSSADDAQSGSVASSAKKQKTG